MAGVGIVGTLDTPERAEAAFYAALENGDLDAMAAVWSQTAEVACVHPGGPQLLGYEQVMQSWREILGNTGGLRMSVELLHQHTENGLSVRFLNETVMAGDQSADAFTVFTTNAYRSTDGGWLMVLHHASPAPRSADLSGDTPRDHPDADDTEVTLH